MKSGSFARLATVTASTQRAGGVDASGQSGDLAPVETDFACTPLCPVTPAVAQMSGLLSFAELLVTYVEGGLDIKGSDKLITGVPPVTYTVHSVGEWYWRPTGTDMLEIILEQPS